MHVEALQGETRRIDLGVARGAGGDCCGVWPVVRGWSWRRECPAPEAARLPAAGGGGVPRMRSSTQAPRLTGEVLVPSAVTFSTPAMVNDAAAMAVGRQRRLAKFPQAFHAGDAVVLRQPAVEHRKVGRHEVGQTQVVFQKLGEEQLCLFDH